MLSINKSKVNTCSASFSLNSTLFNSGQMVVMNTQSLQYCPCCPKGDACQSRFKHNMCPVPSAAERLCAPGRRSLLDLLVTFLSTGHSKKVLNFIVAVRVQSEPSPSSKCNVNIK